MPNDHYKVYGSVSALNSLYKFNTTNIVSKHFDNELFEYHILDDLDCIIRFPTNPFDHIILVWKGYEL